MSTTNSNDPMSPVYREQLLSKLRSIEGFDSLVYHYRDPGGIAVFEIASSMITPAKNIISSYPMHELRVARQQYSTVHFLEVWKRFNKLLKEGIASGTLNRQFPLFTVTSSIASRHFDIQAVSEKNWKSGLFCVVQGEQESFQYSPMIQREKMYCSISEREIFQSLHGRLSYVEYVAKQSLTAVYEKFLLDEKNAKSAFWEAYQIHVFFNMFLYMPESPGFGESRFDLIFFSNNLQELIIFLRESKKSEASLNIQQVIEYLHRQTIYNLSLSQTITLEENHLRYMHKSLLQYDENKGVVCMGEIPDEQLDDACKLFRDTLGIDDLGCPFGRIKGVEKNALVEITSYFDNLFIRILKMSWEFEKLFIR